MFDGVANAYRERGIEIHQPLLHPTASIQKRTLELKNYLDQHIGDRPCHLIGHSMGGLDGRYLISPGGLNQGHRVISLTTLATPHRGSTLADKIIRPLRPVVSLGAWLLHFAIFDPEQREFLSRIGENDWEALDQLSPTYIQNEFNPNVPDHPDVLYFSYGTSRKGKPFRLTDLPRMRGYQLIYPHEGENDSMVSITSAKWGEVKGVIQADHGEIIGLRVVPWIKNGFDHIALFHTIADDLEQLEQTLQPSKQPA